MRSEAARWAALFLLPIPIPYFYPFLSLFLVTIFPITNYLHFFPLSNHALPPFLPYSFIILLIPSILIPYSYPVPTTPIPYASYSYQYELVAGSSHLGPTVTSPYSSNDFPFHEAVAPAHPTLGWRPPCTYVR
jgi:hypothetical protein